MKILYILISGKAGSDVYSERLNYAIKKYSDIKSDLIFIPHVFEIIPFLIPFYLKLKRVDFLKYDLIHTNAEFGHFFKRKERPLFVTAHHSVFDIQYQKYTSFIQKLFHYFWIKPNLSKTLRIADGIIAVSNYTKQSILKTFGNLNIKVIYNGIDTEKFRPLPPKRKDKNIKLLFVGNLIKRKGVDLLPKIINKLGNEYVLYYTSGMRTKNILRHKNMFPLGKLTQDELVEEYNKCDILLFPTRLEGFGYAVAEAMACGKPVVTTNCSSLPELVENGENGFLCEMDNISNFVEKIKLLGEDESLRKTIGTHNKEKILEKFTLEKMVKKYVELYKEFVKN